MAKDKDKFYCIIDHANKLVDRERVMPASIARQGPFRRDQTPVAGPVLAPDGDKAADDTESE
tara:strand:+ start:4408 stop:4593 length:186 start_codon:yes stop_codon:yes gene_type:complete